MGIYKQGVANLYLANLENIEHAETNKNILIHVLKINLFMSVFKYLICTLKRNSSEAV